MKENCQATLSFLGLYDFIATKVEVFNGETQQYETFSLIDENELPLKDKDSTELTDENLDEIKAGVNLKKCPFFTHFSQLGLTSKLRQTIYPWKAYDLKIMKKNILDSTCQL